jgi:hypothetical protein
VRRSNRIRFFKSAWSYAQTTAHGSTLPADSFKVTGRRGRRNVASASTSPIPSVLPLIAIYTRFQ